jgi:hypothetical protein
MKNYHVTSQRYMRMYSSLSEIRDLSPSHNTWSSALKFERKIAFTATDSEAEFIDHLEELRLLKVAVSEARF